MPPPRIAIVGDRSPSVRAHTQIPRQLEAVRQRHGIAVDPYWIPTGDTGSVAAFDGVWLVPGSPYRSESGALAAVRAAREQAIPFLGTCAGFQHAMLEYARNVCGIAGATHAENDPAGGEPLIGPLACSLVGHEGAINLTPGSLIERILGTGRTVERYHCGYGVLPGEVPKLTANGLRVSGVDDDGQARVAELPGHPFFLATLFQPELSTEDTWPHPVITAFAAAVCDR